MRSSGRWVPYGYRGFCLWARGREIREQLELYRRERRREVGVWIDKGRSGTKDSIKVTTVAQPEKNRDILLVIAFLLWRVKKTIFSTALNSPLFSPPPRTQVLEECSRLEECFPTILSLKHTETKCCVVYTPTYHSLSIPPHYTAVINSLKNICIQAVQSAVQWVTGLVHMYECVCAPLAPTGLRCLRALLRYSLSFLTSVSDPSQRWRLLGKPSLQSGAHKALA